MRTAHWAQQPALLAASVLLLAATSRAASGKNPSSTASTALAKGALSTELATLASKGDALQLWERATAGAADAVVEALRRQDGQHSIELTGTDLDELRIWHGQSVSLGLEADGQRYSFMVQSEPQWQRLASVLGTAQGGLLPRHDWDALNRHWLAPVSRGSLLPDFSLEGPVDVYLAQPTALQLFLPHASDAGTVRRVLLRDGAAAVVRGARAVRLRQGLNLPPISLSEFAGIVTADAAERQPLGVLHLLSGVRAAAQAHWNASHPDQSLGLVALELDMSPSGAALLAAPAAGGGARRLRVRRAGDGAIELLPRDGGSTAAVGAEEGRRAVALAAGAAQASEGAWPVTSVAVAKLEPYEKLLRQLITSRLFRTHPASGSAASSPPRGTRVASDVQLRLVDTEAEATTLLQLRVELERRPLAPAGTARSEGQQQQARDGASGAAAAAGSAADAAAKAAVGGQRGSAAAYLASLPDPPDTLQVLAGVGGRAGPHETWTATVQVRGDAQRGTLTFVPLHMQRVDAASDSVQFAPHTFAQVLGLGNGTDVGEVVGMAE